MRFKNVFYSSIFEIPVILRDIWSENVHYFKFLFFIYTN